MQINRLLNVEDRERQNRFLELYLPIADRLARYARAMTTCVDDALDVEAETLLIAFERMDTVRSPQAFLSFVFTIARRVKTHRTQRLSRFRPLMDNDAETFESHDRSPEVSADVRLLYEALSKLPHKQREAVVLFEIVGLPLEDIRDVQGGTLSGVKARVVRGRKKLAAHLTPQNISRQPMEQVVRFAKHAAPVELELYS